MKYTLNGTESYSFFRRTVIPALVFAVAAYLYGIGAFDDPATAKPSVCTTTTTTTPAR